jgi:hypothetical protein
MATTLLELCCCPEEEEEEIDLPNLRVHAPLYRQGPGYKMLSGCPTAGFSMAAVLTQAPLSSIPLLEHRQLYKVLSSPGPA